ncbi:protein kinase domain-containing protein [Caldithrix abyssi]
MNSQQFIGKVFGHFRILEPAGQGGMGLVFKALNTHLDKIVALKMIAPGLSLNEKLLNRFKTEARALARLENPHIVRISDLLEANGQWFIVMEYIEGDTLRDRLKGKRPLPLKEVIEISEQILSALQHAHSAGIVHRDIKPSNILLTRENLVKVTDFGLAKIQENSLIHTHISAVGGTLYYMSPEQVRSLKETDHRTDIYSLGITIYQMATGTVPFDPAQTDFDIRETIVRKPLPRPSTFNPYLPPEFDAFIMKAIEKNPDDRFQSAVEMAQRLAELKEKLKDKLENALPSGSEIDDEINFDRYAFDIKDDFSDVSLAPEIPVEKTPPPASPEQDDEEAKDLSEMSQLTRITELVKNKRLWLISLLPILIILFIIYLISLPPPSGSVPTQSAVTMLSLHSRPPGAQVYMNGQSIGKTPIDSLTIRKGTIALRIEKAGFVSYDSTLMVKGGQHLALDIALLRQTTVKEDTKTARTQPMVTAPQTVRVSETSVTFNSVPPQVDVYLDNRHIGQTPLSYVLKSGQTLNLRVRKAGFKELTRQITVPERQNWNLNLRLEPLEALLTIQSHQWPFEVQIDNRKPQKIDRNTGALRIPPGQRRLIFLKPNFESVEKNLQLQPGEKRTIEVAFTPLYGTLEIHVLPWGNIYIDDQLLKAETNIKNKIRLTAGKHLLRIENPAFSIIEKTVVIEPEKTIRLSYDFNRKVETRVLAFDVNNQPLFVQIAVDGNLTDQYTPAAIRLSPGFHRISVSKQGYKLVDGPAEVMIVQEEKKTLKFILEKE